MRRARGYTLVEIIIAVLLAFLVIGAVYGLLHLLFFSKSRSNLMGLTRRSYIQKDAKAGLRQLLYRVREGIQILSPATGTTGTELVFRDILNSEIRMRLVPAENRVISEVNQGGTWVRETQPTMIDTDAGKVAATFPVNVQNCRAIRFSALGGDCVTIQASLEYEGHVGGMLTVIRLRNASMGY